MSISCRWKEGTHFEARVEGGKVVVVPSAARMMSREGAIAYSEVA